MSREFKVGERYIDEYGTKITIIEVDKTYILYFVLIKAITYNGCNIGFSDTSRYAMDLIKIENEKKDMEINDLKTGMIVEFRRGGLYLVLENVCNSKGTMEKILFLSKDGFMNGSSYRYDFTYKDRVGNSTDWDIVKVYQTGIGSLDLNCEHYERNTIWEEKKKITGIDWESLPIDTKLIISYNNGASFKRFYAGLKDGKPTFWNYEKTSFTAQDNQRCDIESSYKVEIVK